jgi:putative ABC transport system permease protein
MKRVFRLASLRRVPADVEAELSFHFEMTMRELMAQGHSEDDARREAERRFGDVNATRSRIDRQHERQRQRAEWWDGVWQDVRFATRSLRRSPGVTLAIVLTLALGIGANAAMFGIIDRLLLRGPEHVAAPDRLRRVYFTTDRPGEGRQTSSYAGYVSYTALRDGAHAFDGIAGYTGANGAILGRGTNARSASVSYVTWDFFPLTGVRPAFGRFFGAEDDRPPRGRNVAVLSEGTWRNVFGGDSTIVGKSIALNGETFTVIGVAPAGFTGVELERIDVWLPMSVHPPPTPDWPTTWFAEWMKVVVRVAPGVSAERAGEQATIARHHAYTGNSAADSAAVVSLRPITFTEQGHEASAVKVSRWLAGVALIVLLVACANVANLLLARAVSRRREIGVRAALGAGQGRLARLLLVEALLLSIAGGVAALGVAVVGGGLVRAMLLPDVAWNSAPVDARVLAFTSVVIVAVGLLIGLAPALQSNARALDDALKSGARAGAPRSRLRGALTVMQAALCVLLLVGAGLFVRSLSRVRALDLGLQPDRILDVGVWFPSRQGLDSIRREEAVVRERRFYDDAVERVRKVAGVEHASVAVGTPFRTSFAVGLSVPGWDTLPRLAGGGPYITAVSNDHFATLGTRLVLGRVFTKADQDGREQVAIVNETMARTLWPGATPLGKCLQINDKTCTRVIGVVQDVQRESVREPRAMQYYVPLGREVKLGFGGRTLFVRTTGDPARVIETIRRALLPLVPEALDVKASVMQNDLDPEIRPWRMGTTMFGVFGLLALAMAAIGLFSVIAYSVSQRRHELGVRVALGAHAADIRRMILSQGMMLTSGGIAIGLVLALWASRFVSDLLFETSPRDPVVFAVVIVTLLLTALVASILPAARASRVDPMEALRSE